MALDRRTVIWMRVTFGRRVSRRGWLRRLISTLVSTFTWTSVQNRHVDRLFSHWIEGKDPTDPVPRWEREGGRIPRCMVLLRHCIRSPRTKDSYSPFHPTAGERCQRNGLGTQTKGFDEVGAEGFFSLLKRRSKISKGSDGTTTFVSTTGTAIHGTRVDVRLRTTHASAHLSRDGRARCTVLLSSSSRHTCSTHLDATHRSWSTLGSPPD